MECIPSVPSFLLLLLPWLYTQCPDTLLFHVFEFFCFFFLFVYVHPQKKKDSEAIELQLVLVQLYIDIY